MAERAAHPSRALTGERSFRGTPVCGAIAIGPLHLIERTLDASARPAGSPQDELAAFQGALTKARGELEVLLESEDALGGEILEFQAALAEDEDLITPIEARIAAGAPAHRALAEAIDGEIETYRSSGDPVLSARADDLLDLKRRIIRALSNEEDAAAKIRRGSILLAEALTPSQFLDLDGSTIAGIATLTGSPTSHVAILARARGVPLVVGVEMELDAARTGQTAVLDCTEGRLTLEPAAAHLAEAQDRLARTKAAAWAARARAREPARTADGTAITVLINIDDPSTLEDVDAAICDGIGLTRTEFLFREGVAPGEEEQRAFYDRLLRWAGERPVTVRTLDAGGDKPIPGITIDGETNPFLGVRGVRLSLARPDVLRVQLRALMRVAARASPGQLKVMVPMVSVPEEVSAVRALAEEELLRLKGAGVAAAMPALGMMVEVPCAALAAERFEVAFYSIGTNDLIQYLTASARDNAAVAPLADPRNPAVCLVIEHVVAAAARRGVEVSVCGDMASSPGDVASLIAAGVRVLSVAPAQVGAVKAALSALSAGAADG